MEGYNHQIEKDSNFARDPASINDSPRGSDGANFSPEPKTGSKLLHANQNEEGPVDFGQINVNIERDIKKSSQNENRPPNANRSHGFRKDMPEEFKEESKDAKDSGQGNQGEDEEGETLDFYYKYKGLDHVKLPLDPARGLVYGPGNWMTNFVLFVIAAHIKGSEVHINAPKGADVYDRNTDTFQTYKVTDEKELEKIKIIEC